MEFLLAAIGQLAVVLVGVTVFWGVHRLIATLRKENREPWRRWLGLYPPPAIWKRMWIFPAAFLLVWVSLFLQFYVVNDFASLVIDTPAYKITRCQGIDLVLGAIAYPFVTSALTEEICFRGLIAKRMIKYLGFHWGNSVQTLVFLAPHILLIWLFGAGTDVMLVILLLMLIVPMAWISGWVMAKRDDGSIFTPWLIHAGVNFGTIIYFWLWIPTVAATG